MKLVEKTNLEESNFILLLQESNSFVKVVKMMGCCNNSDKKSSKEDWSLEGLICYCFNHSKQSLHDAIKENLEHEIVNDIKSKMKDPGCFCEKSNPSGKCCMSDVMGFIDYYKKNTP